MVVMMMMMMMNTNHESVYSTVFIMGLTYRYRTTDYRLNSKRSFSLGLHCKFHEELNCGQIISYLLASQHSAYISLAARHSTVISLV